MDATGKQVALGLAASYCAFRCYRALTSTKHQVPTQFSRLKETATEEDLGGRIRIAPGPETSAQQLLQDVIPHYRGVPTMWDIFENAAHQYASQPFHGTLNEDHTAYEFTTYQAVYEDIKLLAQGMEQLALFGRENDEGFRLFGLFGPNCSDWMKLEYAAMSQSVALVTLYTTLTGEGVAHVLNMTQVSAIACLTEALAERCLQAQSPTLATMVVLERTSKLEALAALNKVRIVTLGEIRQAGAASPKHALRPPRPESIWTFCFTSGSTGLPKGALLDHFAFTSNIGSQIDRLRLFMTPGKEVYLSFLPLAHQMERTIFGMITSLGGQIGFSRGDVTKIMNDVKLLRPTFFVTVPRLLSRLYKALEDKVSASPFARRQVFAYALETKLGDLASYGHFTHPIWDRVVFGKIREQMGLDRCRIIVTGSAPIAPRVLDTLRVVFAVPVNEGYGQTEATCAITVAHPLHVGGKANRVSHVGGPVQCVEVKLQSIPEMKYLVTDREHDGVAVVGRGEVLARGPNLMKRYYHNPEKTAQTIDGEGWLHTGDVGAWLENGTLSIIDRANNIFKTSVGEYVQPDKIERAVCGNSLAQACFVFGTTLNSRVVCVVVLGEQAASLPHKEVEAALVEQCRASGLLGFEIPAAFAFHTEPFTIESGVLTATSKIVRNVAKEHFKQDLVAMFASLGEEVKI